VRPHHRVEIVSEQFRERLPAFECVLGIRPGEFSHRRQSGSVADAGHYVVKRPARRAVVEGLYRRDRRHAVTFGAASCESLAFDFFGAAVSGDERVEAVSEGVFQTTGDMQRFGCVGKKTSFSAPQCDDAAGVFVDLVPRNRRAAFLAAQAPARGEPAKVCVTCAVFRQQHDAAAVV
jgi:hypothetical protein